MTINGNWKNALGSSLDLKIDNTSSLHGGSKVHQLSGSFTDGSEDETTNSENFDVSGCAIEDSAGNILVSFRVVVTPSKDFPHRSSIVNWSGRLIISDTDGTEKLYTVWTLARLSDTTEEDNGKATRRPTKSWDHTLINADVFFR